MVPLRMSCGFSLFDLKQNGGKRSGDKKTASCCFPKSTERITGNATGLIAHEYGKQYIPGPTLFPNAGDRRSCFTAPIGSDHSFQYEAKNGEGYMKLGAAQQSGPSRFPNPGVKQFYLNCSTSMILPAYSPITRKN